MAILPSSLNLLNKLIRESIDQNFKIFIPIPLIYELLAQDKRILSIKGKLSGVNENLLSKLPLLTTQFSSHSGIRQGKRDGYVSANLDAFAWLLAKPKNQQEFNKIEDFM
jgi:hypothetical protein